MRATKISNVIMPDTMSRKMNNASTLPAMLEARSGHNGKLFNISCLNRPYLTPSPLTPSCPRRNALQSEQHEKQNRQPCANFQHVADDRAVFSSRGIVVIAVEQYLIDGVANLVLGSLHQAH